MSIRTKTARAILLVFAVLFLWSAALQCNDPDPLFWIAVYAMAAVLCVYYGVTTERKFKRAIGILALIFSLQCMVYGLVLWKGFAPGWTGDEEMRESLGLLIIAIVCGFPALLDLKQSRTARVG